MGLPGSRIGFAFKQKAFPGRLATFPEAKRKCDNERVDFGAPERGRCGDPVP